MFQDVAGVIHEKLGVPVPSVGPSEKQKQIDEEKVLASVAEDEGLNPGLHMSVADMREHFTRRKAGSKRCFLRWRTKGLLNSTVARKA